MGFPCLSEGYSLSLHYQKKYKNMGRTNRIIHLLPAILLISSLSTFPAGGQSYKMLIEENPDRAGGVYHYYEYSPTAVTKAPKGYKPFYISHYGRHGSRYHTSAGAFKGSVDVLRKANEKGLLTEEGRMLKRQIDTLWEEHQGMFGMLTERGGVEHRGIGSRMLGNYPSVFKGGRTEVECVSSYWPRCLVSMANCAAALQEGAKGLHFHYVTGPKYLDYISMDLDTEEVRKGSSALRKHLRDSLLDCSRFLCAIFTDTAWVAKVVEPAALVENIYVAGSICPNTLASPAIFSHFTTEELIALWIARNDSFYRSYGISAEAGEYMSAIAKPLIEDIVAKADAAIESGSDRAADLRFGHDVGLLPLVGTIGIKGMEERMKSDGVHDRWLLFQMMPMASNLQMIFFRNKKGDVLVKLQYNDKETSLPRLGEGPYYKWPDLRAYLLETAAAIPDDLIVKDDGEVERTGVKKG